MKRQGRRFGSFCSERLFFDDFYVAFLRAVCNNKIGEKHGRNKGRI